MDRLSEFLRGNLLDDPIRRGLAFAPLWSSRFQDATTSRESRLRADPNSDEAKKA